MSRRSYRYKTSRKNLLIMKSKLSTDNMRNIYFTTIIMDAHSQSINSSIDIPLIRVNFRFKDLKCKLIWKWKWENKTREWENLNAICKCESFVNWLCSVECASICIWYIWYILYMLYTVLYLCLCCARHQYLLLEQVDLKVHWNFLAGP